MLDYVIKFHNGMVIVFDEEGEQLPEYQGKYEEVKDKILADAPPGARFFRGLWMISGGEIPREKW